MYLNMKNQLLLPVLYGVFDFQHKEKARDKAGSQKENVQIFIQQRDAGEFKSKIKAEIYKQNRQKRQNL